MRGRAIQVSLVRKDRPTSGQTPEGAPIAEGLDPEQINDLITDQVHNIAITIGALLLTKKAADTVSELILIAGRKHL